MAHCRNSEWGHQKRASGDLPNFLSRTLESAAGSIANIPRAADFLDDKD
jgi:hypothetical protein